MSCKLTLYVGNSNVIELQELTNSVTGLPDTGATVLVTLKRGTALVSTPSAVEWPVTMSHVSSGTYRATLDEDIGITAGLRYTAEITAVGSGGQTGYWEVPVFAKTRT